ncbi:hypothetical protein WS88_28675 [Burkholderia cepacia]|nr:hypothetical protein WS88_28675 [Burkholderia cepacia]
MARGLRSTFDGRVAFARPSSGAHAGAMRRLPIRGHRPVRSPGTSPFSTSTSDARRRPSIVAAGAGNDTGRRAVAPSQPSQPSQPSLRHDAPMRRCV